MDMLFVWVMKFISLLSFLFVRRKILRLYWADAIVVTDGKLHDGMRSKLK